MKTKTVVLTAVLGMLVACTAMGDMIVATQYFRPGQGLEPDHYTEGEKDWVADGWTLAETLTSDFLPVGGTMGGTITSWAYEYDHGTHSTFGFQYRYDVSKHWLSYANLPGAWYNLAISEFGSGNQGSSTERTGEPTWEDGAPLFLRRVATGPAKETIRIQWNADWPGNPQPPPEWGDIGTEIHVGQYSADMWFVTDVEEYGVLTSTMFNHDGNASGMILAPVPEPTSITLLIVGALLALGRRRRKVSA